MAVQSGRAAVVAMRTLGAEIEGLASRVIGAAIEVHRALGPGHLEAVYHEAMVIELTLRRIPFVREKPIEVVYRRRRVGEGRVDLLVADRVIVELKAVEALAPVHTAQVISYLKATGLRLGLLMNFNVPVLKDGLRRIIV